MKAVEIILRVGRDFKINVGCNIRLWIVTESCYFQETCALFKKKINVETVIVEFKCKINVDYHYQTRIYPVTFTLLIRKGGNHRAGIK